MALEMNQTGDIYNLDFAWLLLCTFLIFFMQTGFMMLETGGVARKILYDSIILKNMITCPIAAIVFYIVVYGFAFGEKGAALPFIGANFFALSDNPRFIHFFLQWAYLSTCVTIPSGAMAERTRLRSHCYWVLVASFLIYPFIAHWIWSNDGWLSAYRDPPLIANGVLDFAGSGVIHLLGGTAGVVGAGIAGKRAGRYEDKFERQMVFLPQNIGEMALGTFILWFSWYGFNCGSTLALSGGRSLLAGRIAVNTTISASTGGIVALLIIKFRTKKWSLVTFLNGTLSGLVAITAGCAFVEPWASLIIGFIAGIFYYLTKLVEDYLKIDDVIEVGSVHLANGFWGLTAVGLFATKDTINTFYGRETAHSGLFVGGGGYQLAIQLIAAVIIFSWSFFWSYILFWILKRTDQLRIDPDWERQALEEEIIGIEVKSTLQLMAHNYDMDNNYIRNIETENSHQEILNAEPVHSKKSEPSKGKTKSSGKSKEPNPIHNPESTNSNNISDPNSIPLRNLSVSRRPTPPSRSSISRNLSVVAMPLRNPNNTSKSTTVTSGTGNEKSVQQNPIIPYSTSSSDSPTDD